MNQSIEQRRQENSEAHHAPGVDGAGYTLCGYALEGECADGGDPPPIVVSRGQKITCYQCNAIIEHCRDKFQSEKIAGMYRRSASRAARESGCLGDAEK